MMLQQNVQLLRISRGLMLSDLLDPNYKSMEMHLSLCAGILATKGAAFQKISLSVYWI